jgi:hypothetical protein
MKMAFYDEVGKPTVLDKGPFLSGFCCGIGPKGLDRVQGPLAHAQDAGRDRSACRNESRLVSAAVLEPYSSAWHRGPQGDRDHKPHRRRRQCGTGDGQEEAQDGEPARQDHEYPHPWH